MKIEVYERKDKCSGIYISGDLTGEIPKTFFHRDVNGKVTEISIEVSKQRVNAVVDSLYSILITELMRNKL